MKWWIRTAFGVQIRRRFDTNREWVRKLYEHPLQYPKFVRTF